MFTENQGNKNEKHNNCTEFKRQTKSLAQEMSWEWIGWGNLKRKIVSRIIAEQNNAIR